MKLGFVLSNYKAKLQIEIRSLSKKLASKRLFDKIFVKFKVKKQIKIKKELLECIDNYIKDLEQNNIDRLEKKVSSRLKIGNNITKVRDLIEILDKL